MNNKHEHIYDDCIGNPPFDGAIKILDENYLTEPQRKHFEEKKAQIEAVKTATETEENLKKIKQPSQVLKSPMGAGQLGHNLSRLCKSAPGGRTYTRHELTIGARPAGRRFTSISFITSSKT